MVQRDGKTGVQVDTRQFRILEKNNNDGDTEDVQKMLQMSDTEWNERGCKVNTVDDGGGSNNEKNEVNSFTNYSAKNEKHNKEKKGLQIIIRFADTEVKEEE